MKIILVVGKEFDLTEAVLVYSSPVLGELLLLHWELCSSRSVTEPLSPSVAVCGHVGFLEVTGPKGGQEDRSS